jgi:hypothetical protein
MRTNLPLLALLVSALVLGPAGTTFAGDSSLQPLQLAKLDNGRQCGSARKASKKK